MYDPHNELQRKLLAFVYTPIVQRECDTFVTIWNTHRIWEQKDLQLPTGVLHHMFSSPEKYGGVQDWFQIQTEHIKEVADLSNVLEETTEFLDEEFITDV